MKPFVKNATLAALLAAGACSKPAPKPPEPAAKSRLQEIVESLNTTPPCSSAIPFEWSPSWPVPVMNGGKLEYRAFFFGREGKLATGFRFHRAEGDVVFAPKGRIGECRRRTQPGAAIPPDRRTPSDAAEKSRKLYALSEEIAALYASGRALPDAERAKVRAFASAFNELTDPGQAEDYRALSPAFWGWLEKNGGSFPAARKQ